MSVVSLEEPRPPRPTSSRARVARPRWRRPFAPQAKVHRLSSRRTRPRPPMRPAASIYAPWTPGLVGRAVPGLRLSPVSPGPGQRNVRHPGRPRLHRLSPTAAGAVRLGTHPRHRPGGPFGPPRRGAAAVLRHGPGGCVRPDVHGLQERRPMHPRRVFKWGLERLLCRFGVHRRCQCMEQLVRPSSSTGRRAVSSHRLVAYTGTTLYQLLGNGDAQHCDPVAPPPGSSLFTLEIRSRTTTTPSSKT